MNPSDPTTWSKGQKFKYTHPHLPGISALLTFSHFETLNPPEFKELVCFETDGRKRGIVDWQDAKYSFFSVGGETPQPYKLPDSGERTHFPTGAQRDTAKGKGFPHMIPPLALARLEQHFEKGAEKYDKNNFLKGINLTRFYDGIMRHARAAACGDTSEDHLAAVLWNAAVWMHTEAQIRAGKLPAELFDLPYHPDFVEEKGWVMNPEYEQTWVHCGMMHHKGDPCPGCNTYEDGTRALL